MSLVRATPFDFGSGHVNPKELLWILDSSLMQVINISFSSHRYLQEVQYLFRLIIFCPKYCPNCYFKHLPEVAGGGGGFRRSCKRLSSEVEEICGGGKLVERKYA
ncbi:hypothetical protein Adt_12198 [Abeliophyllum distichum]|uniref:Uncharacterized protein n=1 Tax=Abeliophyllum distichum TaxID=126358 RepID=A0ABD1UQ20_9LAMI